VFEFQEDQSKRPVEILIKANLKDQFVNYIKINLRDQFVNFIKINLKDQSANFSNTHLREIGAQSILEEFDGCFAFNTVTDPFHK
jgi:hypothetical protein